MLAVYALLGRLSLPVAGGALFSGTLGVANFFIMGLTVQNITARAAEKQRDEAELATKAHALRERLDLDHLLLTRSEEGMSLFSRDGSSRHVAARAREVYDVSGAGDTVVATLATALAVGCAIEVAVGLANTAGGIVVGKLGTADVTPQELFGE